MSCKLHEIEFQKQPAFFNADNYLHYWKKSDYLSHRESESADEFESHPRGID